MDESKKELLKKLWWVLFFSIWLAYIESAVVVYLRELYYPEGFQFPIKLIAASLGLIEIGRELATIFVLLSIGYLAGKTGWTRFAFFMFSFSVWDIWYYIWLKVFLNWPASFLTWDLLFLIPVPWVGPVIAPVIVSISLIVAALFILSADRRGERIKLYKWEWVILISAAAFILASFMIDASLALKGGIPQVYHWELFGIGEILGMFIFGRGWQRFCKLKK